MTRLTTPGGRRRADAHAIHLGSMVTAVAMLAAALSTQSAIAASPEPGGVATRVAVEDFAFSPASVTIDAGTSVVWAVRKDPEQHTVTPLDPDAFAASGQLFDGDDYTVRFERTGRYDYACSLHPFMIGTVVVRAPAATPAVTPTSSTASSPVSSASSSAASSSAQAIPSIAPPAGSARPGSAPTTAPRTWWRRSRRSRCSPSSASRSSPSPVGGGRTGRHPSGRHGDGRRWLAADLRDLWTPVVPLWLAAPCGDAPRGRSPSRTDRALQSEFGKCWRSS